MNPAVAYELNQFAERIIWLAKTDHDREMGQRAHVYAWRRLEDGSAKTFQEAKLVFAAFGDGWCTGVTGGGNKCLHNSGGS